MYLTTQERKHSQLGLRGSIKEYAASVVSMGIHLTIAPTTNQTGSSRSRDGKTSNKICNWCGKYGQTAQNCRNKQQRERGNAAIDEEDYVKEMDEDCQSDNESVAEVGFVAKEVEHERGLACLVDGISYPSFTEDTMFGDSDSSCHISNIRKPVTTTRSRNSVVGILYLYAFTSN